MKPAIIETAMSQLVEEGRELLANVVKSEAEAAWNRVVLGRFLQNARSKLPRRGTATNGWTAFLEALEIDDSTASRYIALAEATVTLTERDKDKVPTYAELGLDKREGAQQPETSPPADDDAPAEMLDASANALQPSVFGEPPDPPVEIDRDTWCTPKEIAELIGDWDLDPCSNERSHIRAAREFRLEERSEDGLLMASKVDADARVFVNPPYSKVGPWIEAYAHTRFCFLLKLDPSTAWFERIFELSEIVLVPRGTRVAFEPPPGVPADKAKANQFPHAFFYARAVDATTAIREFCFPAWRTK